MAFSFDATSVAPAQTFDLIPAGTEAVAIITETAIKATSTGGEMLKLTVQIAEGEWKGRKIWENLNVVNANPKAQEIALGQLSSICRAVGVMQFTDPAQLKNRPLSIKIGVQPEQGQYEARNKVTAWKAVTAPLPSLTVGSLTSSGSSEGNGSAKPWAASRQESKTVVNPVDGHPDDVPF